MSIQAGTVTGNYFSGGGYLAGAHADAIFVGDTLGPVSITNNFIDWTANPGTVLPNDAVRITTEVGNTSNVTVSGNYLIGGGYTVSAGAAGKGAFSNISVTGNYIGFGQYGAFYPGAGAGDEITGNTIFDYSNPIYSTQAWTAYMKRGHPDQEPCGVDGNECKIGNSSGTTTFYGGGYNVIMLGRRTKPTYVGGAGAQHML